MLVEEIVQDLNISTFQTRETLSWEVIVGISERLRCNRIDCNVNPDTLLARSVGYAKAEQLFVRGKI